MSKYTNLLAAACLSILALPLGAMACDEEKSATCGTKEAVAKVVAAKSDCSSTCNTQKSVTEATVLSLASGATCGGANAKVATVVATTDDACEAGCPAEQTARLLVRAIEHMDEQGGRSSGARADVLVALQTMAKAKPGIVCSEKLASLAGTGRDLTTYEVAMTAVQAKLGNETKGSSSCSDAAKVAQLVASAKSCDGAADAKTAAACATTCSDAAKATQLVASATSCDGGADAKTVAACATTCSDAAKATQLVASATSCDGGADVKTVAACATTCGDAAKATQAVANATSCESGAKASQVLAAGTTCESSTEARFVAYGCDKTDRVARIAARAYLDLMHEIKRYTGAADCAGQTATQVLAAVLEDMHREYAAGTAQTATEVAVVSFGAVGDGSECDESKCDKSKCDAAKCDEASRAACCPDKK